MSRVIRAGQPLAVLTLIGLVGCTPPPEPEVEERVQLSSDDIEFADCIFITSGIEVLIDNLNAGETSRAGISLDLIAEDAREMAENYSGGAQGALQELASAASAMGRGLDSNGEIQDADLDNFLAAMGGLDPYC